MAETRVLFVCMGNICRSPMAEGVFTHALRAAGLAECVDVDSAGTHAYHVGKPPDARARSASSRRGIDIGGLRARQVSADDFAAFDHILAMDRENYDMLRAACPKAHRDKVRLYLDLAPELRRREVPDPYYGGERGFDEVLDLVEAGARGLLAELREGLAGRHCR